MNGLIYLPPLWWCFYGFGVYAACMERLMTLPPIIVPEEDDDGQ